jgi:metal-responsive CopG/Arc/MetJ family transcriptional regulator
MKTAVSIPDEVFKAAERAAKKLGVSRSELYANAVKEFIEHHRSENVTEKLNKVYAEDESASKLDRRLEALQTRSLEKEDWE